MKTPNLGTVSYAPGDPPSDPAQLQRFLREELLRVSVAISALAAGHMDKQTVAPSKPRDGDVRYADGVLWNPGSGVGVYYFKGTTAAWVFLG